MSDERERIEAEPIAAPATPAARARGRAETITMTVGFSPPAEVRTAEHWQKRRQVPDWLHLGAVRLHRWGVGRELTEVEYTNGVDAMANCPVER